MVVWCTIIIEVRWFLLVSAAGDVNSVHHHSHRQNVNLAMAVAWSHRHGRQCSPILRFGPLKSEVWARWKFLTQCHQMSPGCHISDHLFWHGWCHFVTWWCHFATWPMWALWPRGKCQARWPLFVIFLTKNGAVYDMCRVGMRLRKKPDGARRQRMGKLVTRHVISVICWENAPGAVENGAKWWEKCANRWRHRHASRFRCSLSSSLSFSR